MSPQSSSSSEDSAEPTFFGAICTIIAVGIIFLIIKFYTLAWPSSLWLTFAGFIWICTVSATHPITAAIAKITFPFIVGLLAVATAQIYFNMQDVGFHNLYEIERTLLELHNDIPSWMDFSWWQFCTIIIILFVLNLWVPRIRLVEKFLWVTKIFNGVCAVLAAIICFTFFAQQAALKPLAVAEKKIVAQIAEARERNWSESMRLIAILAVTEQIEKISAEEKKSLFSSIKLLMDPPRVNKFMLDYMAIYENIHSIRLKNNFSSDKDQYYRTKNLTNELLGVFLLRYYKKSSGYVDLNISIKKEDLHKRNYELIDILKRENIRTEEILSESNSARTALNAAISKTTNGLTDSVASLVKLLIENHMEGYSEFLVEHAKEFSSEVASNYFDKLRKPLIKQLVDHGVRFWENVRILGGKAISQEIMKETVSKVLDRSGKLIAEARSEGEPRKLEIASELVMVAKEIAFNRLDLPLNERSPIWHKSLALQKLIIESKIPVENLELKNQYLLQLRQAELKQIKKQYIPVYKGGRRR